MVAQVAALMFRKPPEFEEALALCDIEADEATERRINALRIQHGYRLINEVGACLGRNWSWLNSFSVSATAIGPLCALCSVIQGDYAAGLGHLMQAQAPVKHALSLFPQLLPEGVALSNKYGLLVLHAWARNGYEVLLTTPC